jgi:hypothetical protein
MKRTQLSLEYRFTLPDGFQEVFAFHLDPQSLELCLNPDGERLAWTELSFHQCSNCPLTVETHPYCPAAENIAHIVGRLDERLLSCDEVRLDVTTEQRVVSKHTAAQRGVSSLIGLVMANSACPHTAFFRPMARFHQPFATIEETIFRAASMYLLSQYFRRQKGWPAELELDGLKQIYENIHIVNSAMAERLRAVSSSDLSTNAVISLDLYAQAFPNAITKTLQNLRSLFAPFLGLRENYKDYS